MPFDDGRIWGGENTIERPMRCGVDTNDPSEEDAGRGRSKTALRRYLDAIQRYELLTSSGEYRLAVQGREGVEAARRELVEANLRLVVKIAFEYRHSGLALDDLIAEGNFGLIKAAERFDPDRGVRFIGYAAWWVRKYMLNAIQQASRQSSAPIASTGPSSATWDASAPAHRKIRRRVLSFEEFAQDSGDRPLVENLAPVGVPDPEEIVLADDLARAVTSVLPRMPKVERDILRHHFGLDGAAPETLREIGFRLGYTRERVRQLELRALERARRLLMSDGIGSP